MSRWICAQCQTYHPTQSVVSGATTWLWVLFIAFGMIFIGILLLMVGPLSSPNGVSGGGVILIGPIPILFGNGTYSTPLIVVSAVITIIALIFFVFAIRRAH
ncbi:MAG TPA: DUF131 domain-containing protein [Candidatus Saccharimonadales bacterium]|nr:DUF131 domain-containing protein [Candidatus Saccharimonadales bacterium]